MSFFTFRRQTNKVFSLNLRPIHSFVDYHRPALSNNTRKNNGLRRHLEQLHRFFTPASYCNNSTMSFVEDKDRYLQLDMASKRKWYACKSDYFTLEKIPSWKESSSKEESAQAETLSSEYPVNSAINEKVSIFVGDITALEIDAIVNAANKTLRGGGGVDGAIHRAAGPSLKDECISLNGCGTGEAKITGGYRLPARYVIHTVGPIGEKPDMLTNCYVNCLRITKENGLKSIAFPCISTGVYGYPNERAAHIALKCVRTFLDNHAAEMDRVIFCLFLPVDVEIYKSLMPKYFPI